ncbi:MAG TPA: cell division protein FtsQ/DivIB [Capillimicrobium sp.]|nr:cell division protein FtsQ/DivIB [Capillimicrobium sp.]
MAVATRRLLRARARVWVAVALVLALAATGGWFWLRDSGLVRVEQVTITGVAGPGSRAVRDALDQTAREMTTLHVDEERLRRAVAVYPQVKDLRVEAKPLHELRIDVVERTPVAALAINGQRVPVAADGTLLRGRISADGLPAVAVSALPGGGRVSDRTTMRVLALAAAAPGALRRHVTRVEHGDEGFVAAMRNGPRVLFGDDQRPRAKWVAAARVLSDESSEGATYIDVRLPERPAAGGFAETGDPPVADPSTSTTG